jgi:hypothetical protein
VAQPGPQQPIAKSFGTVGQGEGKRASGSAEPPEYLEQRGGPSEEGLFVSEKGQTQGCSLFIRGVQK